jgi:hypothetical protein
MKHFYSFRFTQTFYSSLLLSFCMCFFIEATYGQALVIDASAPRVVTIPSNGLDLSSTTYNYVRVPELLALDSIKPDGTFFRSLLLAWATFIDSASLPPGIDPKVKTAWTIDNGSSWTVSANTARFGSSMKTKSGKIVALEFTPDYVDNHNFPLIYYTSVNNGSSWITHTDGMIQFTQTVLGLRMHKNMMEEPDGTLYTSAYVRYSFSTTFRTYVLKSIDGGKTWKPMLDGSGNPIEIDASGAPTDEGTLTRCPDGSWLMIMKQVTVDPDVTLPLVYSRSTDKGQTWSTPAQLPGAGAAASGKNPHVVLMPNGVLALSYGTPDVELTFSANNGNTWTTPIATFPDPGTTKRPSGNTWVVSVEPNKLLQFGDNYAKTINPNTQAIWQKEIQIVRPEQNRIDLKTKQSLGLVTIMSPQTTLTYSNAAHPEARTTGAFDGSPDYWSAAMGTTSGVYQLDLQKTYNIQTIGVSLLYNTPESATIDLSPDGSTWTTVKTYTNASHYCLNYTNITPVSARYVRVTVNGSGQVGLGELELYEASSTFEANATTPTATVHGIIPPGYTQYGTSATEHGMSVRDNVGYQSNRGLTLYDGSGGWIAGIKKIVAASNKKTLEFRCRAAAIPTGGSFSMRVMGTVGGVESVVFFLAVFPDGSLKANQGAGWTKIIGAAGTIPIGTWKLIKIESDESANTASVYIDGVLKGSCTMYAAPASATNLTGFAFASNGTATLGEIVYFDDINFYDPTVSGGSGVASIASPQDVPLSISVMDMPVTDQKFSISASPNPASEIVKIIVKGASSGILNIQFTNLWGKKVKQSNYSLENGSSELNVPINGLLQGIYVLTARQNGHISQTKLIIK